MLSRRALLGWLLALTAVLALGPAANAFACGPSAGDCQYTDPLSATTTTTAHETTAPPVTTSPPLQTTTPTATTADPATATTTTTTTSSKSSKTLPYTGYAAWVAGALGVFLIAGGLAVRRRYVTR